MKCEFCDNQYRDEEFLRAHVLFTHGFIMPTCSLKETEESKRINKMRDDYKSSLIKHFELDDKINKNIRKLKREIERLDKHDKLVRTRYHSNVRRPKLYIETNMYSEYITKRNNLMDKKYILDNRLKNSKEKLSKSLSKLRSEGITV